MVYSSIWKVSESLIHILKICNFHFECQSGNGDLKSWCLCIVFCGVSVMLSTLLHYWTQYKVIWWELLPAICLWFVYHWHTKFLACHFSITLLGCKPGLEPDQAQAKCSPQPRVRLGNFQPQAQPGTLLFAKCLCLHQGCGVTHVLKEFLLELAPTLHCVSLFSQIWQLTQKKNC